MGYTQESLKNRMAILNGEKKSDDKKGPPFQQWKPVLSKEGTKKKYSVRFLPYNDGHDQPIEEVVYYDCKQLAPYRLVAPSQYGMEDPIAEFLNNLRKQRRDKDFWVRVMKPLTPMSRYYIPLIVREEADKGPQVWEFGNPICKQIYEFLMHEDFQGKDVSSVIAGYDFTVTVTPSSKTFTNPVTGKVYPVNDITVIPSFTPSKLSKNAEEVNKWVESIPKLKDIFKSQVRDFEELKEMVSVYTDLTASSPNKASGTNPIEESLGREPKSDDDILKRITDDLENL